MLNFVTGAMFIVLPTFRVAARSWVGLHVGRIADGLLKNIRNSKDTGSREANAGGASVEMIK